MVRTYINAQSYCIIQWANRVNNICINLKRPTAIIVLFLLFGSICDNNQKGF